MPELEVPDEQAIKVVVAEACASVAGQDCGRHVLHERLKQTVARLSSQFTLSAQTEYPLPRYRGDRNGYLDVVWECGAIPVVAFEIDSACRVKSIDKLLAVNANLRFWIYYGRDDGAAAARRIDPAGIIRVIELRMNPQEQAKQAETRRAELASSATTLHQNANRPGMPISFEESCNHYPGAYERWTPEDDRLLEMRYRSGEGIWELAIGFQRKPDAIYSRLRKLDLLADQDGT